MANVFNVVPENEEEEFPVDFGEVTQVSINDFNKLENRPSYAGGVMTGDTNIPQVPTKVSELSNDSNYQNANEVASSISAHNQSSSSHQDIRQLITDEATTRLNADNGLQGQIDAITSASDVVDIVGNYAELQAYDTQHLKDNDVIKVLQDETHNDAMTYYRWSTSTHIWTYVGSEGPYYTKSETNSLLEEKLDVDEVPDNFFDGPATVTPTSATTVTIQDSIKFKSIKLLGNTTQQTYTGKNLFNANHTGSPNANATESVTNSNIEVTATAANTGYYAVILPNSDNLLGKTCTLSIGGVETTATNATNGRVAVYQGVISGDGLPIGTAAGSIIGAASGNTVTFTFPDSYSTGKDCFCVVLYTSNATSTSAVIGDKTVYSNIQLEIGNTATAYEPYVGGIPSPNPDYPQTVNTVAGTQTVQVTGKNLFNPALFDGLEAGSDGGYVTTAYYTSTTEVMFNLEPNTDYTLSLRDIDGNLSGTAYSPAVNGTWKNLGNGYTVIQTNNEGQFSLKLGASSYGNIGSSERFIQLEKGSTATAYVPYQAQTYTVDLGSIELCKIGTNQDYIYKTGNNWYLHKETGKYTFNGGETISYNSGNHGFIVNAHNTQVYFSGIADAPLLGFSTHFAVNSTTVTWTINNTIGLSSSNTFWCRASSFANSLQDCQTWLTNNTPSVHYTLGAATETQITDSALISQLNALLNASLYQPTTAVTSSGNLPAILEITAFTDNLNSILEIASEPEPVPVTYSDFVGTDGVTAGTAGLVPAPATTDAGKFLKADGTWDTAGGGSTVNVVQTIGTSQTDVMSQNTVSGMVFNDPSAGTKIRIGNTSNLGSNAVSIGSSADGRGSSSVSIGYKALTNNNAGAVAIGANAAASAQYSIALGYQAKTSRKGEINVGAGSYSSYGYNGTSPNRVIGGVYDGQLSNDAVTVNQVNATIDAINTALSTNIPHIGASN